LDSINKILKFSTSKDSNIHKIFELKPAGIQLIIKPNTELIELLRLTLFDLLLNKVLVVKKVLKKSHPRDIHLREYIIVEAGEKFTKYSPSKFEKHFTERIDKDSYFLLKVYLRAILKEIFLADWFKKGIVRDLGIQKLFWNKLISNIFIPLRTNTTGKRKKKEIVKYLNTIDENINYLIENENEKAVALINFLGANIFLLKTLNYEFLNELKLELDLKIFTAELMQRIIETFDTIDDYYTENTENEDDWDGGDFIFD